MSLLKIGNTFEMKIALNLNMNYNMNFQWIQLRHVILQSWKIVLGKGGLAFIILIILFKILFHRIIILG